MTTLSEAISDVDYLSTIIWDINEFRHLTQELDIKNSDKISFEKVNSDLTL